MADDLPPPIARSSGAPRHAHDDPRRAAYAREMDPGPAVTKCPDCGSDNIQQMRTPTVTLEQTKELGVDLDDPVVQEYNRTATMYDTLVCLGCGEIHYVKNRDLGIMVGGQKLRVTSYVCDDCSAPGSDFECGSLEELVVHRQQVHGNG